MAFLTLGDAKVSEGALTVPSRGRVVFDGRVTSEVQKGARLELVFDGGPSVVVTVQQVEQDTALWRVRAVGGAGGLGKTVKPKYYEGIPAATVIRDILTECGEQIGDIDFPGVFTRYVREGGRASSALLAVLDGTGYTYRVGFDGRVRVFKAGVFVETDAEVEFIELMPNAGRATVNIAPEIQPGVIVDGFGQVSRVVHHISGRALRSTLYAPEFDVSIFALANHAKPRIDHSALYAASVLKDWGNHLVDLQPDRADFPAQVRIPLKLTVPGVSVKVKVGARVLLGFENSDPSKPFAMLTDVSQCELFQLSTPQGHVLKLDDDRGQTTDDAVYANPTVSVTHKTGANVLIDKDGNITLTPAATKLLNLGGAGGAFVARHGDVVMNGLTTVGVIVASSTTVKGV